MSQVRTLADANALATAAAEEMVSLADEAIRHQGRFSIALSGGSTPRLLYELVASEAYAQRLDWANVHVFWGDERCVPPDHADSSYLMAREALLDHIALPPANVYRIQGEIKPEEAAAAYEQALRVFFGNERPRFDLILLGMGEDGHTASLFPGTAALTEAKRWVMENYVPAKPVWRVTLTKTAINAALNILFLVSGKGKAERLRQVLQGEFQPERLPSQLVKPDDGRLVWLVDREAAALL